MHTTERRTPPSNLSFEKVFEDWIGNATEDELDEALINAGECPEEILERANRAIEYAIEYSDQNKKQKEEKNKDFQEPNKALSVLINMFRRKKGFSIEKLAREVQVKAEELFKIEDEEGYTPSPRTIHQLEKYFSLPARSLMKLSGNIFTNNEKVSKDIVRFAAHSKHLEQLTDEEKRALNKFVKLLEKSTRS